MLAKIRKLSLFLCMAFIISPLFALGPGGKRLNKAPSMLLAKSDNPINACAWSPDGSLFFTSWDNTLLVWDAYTNKPVQVCTNITSPVVTFAYSSDWKYFVVVTEDNSVIISHTQSFKELARLKGEEGAKILSAAFTNDSLYLEVPLDGETIYNCFRLVMTKKFLSTKLEGHKNTVYSLNTNRRTNQMLSTSKDGNVILWNMNTRTMENKFKAYTSSGVPAIFSPNGETFILPESKNTVSVRNIYGDVLLQIKDADGPVNTAVYSPDSSLIAFAVKSGGISIYEVESGKQTNYLAVPASDDDRIGQISTFDFSPDGNYIIAGTTKGYLFRWSLSGKVYAQSAAETKNIQNEIKSILQDLEDEAPSIKPEEYLPVDVKDETETLKQQEEKKIQNQKEELQKKLESNKNLDLNDKSNAEVALSYKKPNSTFYFGAGYTTMNTDYYYGNVELNLAFQKNFKKYPLFMGLDVKLGGAKPTEDYPYNYFDPDGKQINDPWLYTVNPGLSFGCELYSLKGVRLFFDVAGGASIRMMWNNELFASVMSPVYYGYFVRADAGVDFKFLTFKAAFVYDANMGVQNSASVGFTKRIYPKKRGRK